MQARDHAGTAREFLACGRLDPYNAVAVFSEAVFAALIGRDRGLAREVLAALDRRDRTPRSVGSRAGSVRPVSTPWRVVSTPREVGSWRHTSGFADLGAVRRQALTGLVMASVLGGDDTAVRAAIDESRRLFERMGAGLWLAELDDALASTRGSAATTLSTEATADARG